MRARVAAMALAAALAAPAAALPAPGGIPGAGDSARVLLESLISEAVAPVRVEQVFHPRPEAGTPPSLAAGLAQALR